MFKSLRWRLQVWHTLVLLVVLTSFGLIVYDLQWKTRLQSVDAELNRITNSLFVRSRPGPRAGGRRQRNRDEVRAEGENVTRSEQGAPPQQETANTEPQPEKGVEPPRPQLRPGRTPPVMLEEFEKLTHSDEDSNLYLVIWNEKGEVHASESAPKIENPGLHAEADGTPRRILRDRQADQIYRELVFARGYDSGTRNYLIGQSLQKELAEHHHRGWLLVGTGLVILAAGTLGGGWLTTRAIRPIHAMTATAESISAQNFSQRINVEDTDSEFGKLANVLNGTFDRLQSAFERQQQFTADASHELRTPLSVIATHTELALARPRSAEDYRAAIETCQRASRKMKSLIDALLVLARFDSGTPSLKQDRLDLEPLVQDCVELVRPLAAERGIQIDSQTCRCEVVGDYERLSQVVINLLSNAIRYNVDSGQIQVSTQNRNGKAIIAVTDSGIGIAADQLSRIFDRFYQVDKARSRADGSCGLGLSICKTIVESHNGTITVSSQRGIGTTFEVQLNLSMASESSRIADSSEKHLVTTEVGA